MACLDQISDLNEFENFYKINIRVKRPMPVADL